MVNTSNAHHIVHELTEIHSYAEAHKIKLKSDALEAWELEKWHSERQQDLLQKEAKFKFNKQQVRFPLTVTAHNFLI